MLDMITKEAIDLRYKKSQQDEDICSRPSKYEAC